MRFAKIPRKLVMLLAASAMLIGMPVAAAFRGLGRHGGTGWIRLAHLSPNTPPVDVYLYSFGDSNAQIVLHHVAYGTVSPYEAVTPGDYSVAMRNSGAAPSSQPVLSTSVTVKANHAYTVAGMGPESGLRLQVLNDQLTTPSGKSEVRVIQASLKQQTVKFTCGGQAIVPKATFASVSSYQAIPANTWTMEAIGSGSKAHGALRTWAPGPCTRWWSSTALTASRSSTSRTPRAPASRRSAGSPPGSAGPPGTARDRRCRGWRSSGPAAWSPWPAVTGCAVTPCVVS